MWKIRKTKLAIFILGLFLFLGLIAPILAKSLILEKPLRKADAILVLSGSSVYIERTHKASRLYKKGVAKRVLLTDDGGRAGWSKRDQWNPPFVYLAKQELIAQGVPAEQIEILAPQVNGTIYEARVLRDRIAHENWDAVMLVTSAYHSRRTLWTFERELSTEDIEIGISSPPTGEQTPPPFTWWLEPKGWKLVAGEYVKFMGYWLFY